MRAAAGRCSLRWSGLRRAAWAALLLAAGCSSPDPPEPPPFPFADFEMQLAARPVPGEAAQTWEQMKAVGGLLVLDPVRLPDGTVLLPLACDVSGLSNVSTPATQQNPGRVVSRTESMVAGDNIQFRIVTGLPAHGASVHAPPLSLGRLAPGEYRVEYANPSGWRVPLRTVTVGPEREAAAEPASALAPAAHFRGVIVPEERAAQYGLGADGYWTPTAAEAFAAENCMLETLLLAAWRPDEALGEVQAPDHRRFQVEELAKIVAHLDQYALQFAGVIVGGERRVLINAYTVDAFDGELSRRAHSDWIQVHDGGYEFWTIQYDPALDRCVDFASNGYA
jgi:hypothetical protein